MSEFMFGVSRAKPTRAEASRMERIAKKHGAYLVEANVPGTGYQRWFCTQNLGEPFNSRTARAVLAEIAEQPEPMPVPRGRPHENAEERAGRERAEEDRFDYLHDEGLLRRR